MLDIEDDELTTVQIDHDAVRYGLQNSAEFFIQFFMGPLLIYAIPAFHIYLFEKFKDLEVNKIACAIPRDHAKTTLTKLVCIWYLLFTKIRFIVYVSATSTLTVQACKDIIAFMESPNFVAVFGQIEFEVKQENFGLYVFRLGNKRCILRALGAGQQIRGLNIDNQRPQLAIVDDLEDLDNTATPALRKKLKEWFYGPFMKAMDKVWNKVIQIGNLIATTCLLNDHIEDKEWHPIRVGCILSNGKPLWEEAFPLDKLLKDYIAYQRRGLAHVWLAEMMNLPVPAGDALMDISSIEYMPAVNYGDCEYGFITVDPAISEENWANKTAIVAHGFVKDYNAFMPVEYVHERGIGPLDLIDMAIAMAVRWGFTVIGVENSQYQASLQHFFKYFLAKYQQYGIQVVPIASYGKSKTARIAAWCGMLTSKEYVLPEGDMAIATQISLYDPNKRDNDDDLIECCAFGDFMISEYGGLIVVTNQAVDVKPVELGSYEVCPI